MGIKDLFTGGDQPPQPEQHQGYGTYDSVGYTGRADLPQWQELLNNQKIVEEMRHRLRNEIEVTDKGGYTIWVSQGDPLINEKGINAVMYLVSSYTSQMFALSVYTDEEIKERCKEFAVDLVWKFAENQEEYGIMAADITVIKNLLVNMLETTLKKSLNGKMLNIFSQTTDTRQVIAAQKSGIMDKIFGR